MIEDIWDKLTLAQQQHLRQTAPDLVLHLLSYKREAEEERARKAAQLEFELEMKAEKERSQPVRDAFSAQILGSIVIGVSNCARPKLSSTTELVIHSITIIACIGLMLNSRRAMKNHKIMEQQIKELRK